MKQRLKDPVFKILAGVAAQAGTETYVIGGYVRDLLLERPSKDIDIVTVGSGVELAQAFAQALGPDVHINIFKNFGTAQVQYKGLDIEFVGARKESYNRDSRKPVVENGTMEDDLNRRDFTINTLAISLNKDSYEELTDRFGGLEDMGRKLIRTPLDPHITFSDDPLRMVRAIRFATQLQFFIDEPAMQAIRDKKERIGIVSAERVSDELNKIMLAPKPSLGWKLLEKSGLLPYILPELQDMKGVEVINKVGHKDNFYHTLLVLDHVAEISDNLWLRWAALLHDIGKPPTRKFVDNNWTFHGHDFVGTKLVPKIFSRLRLPQNTKMQFVIKLVKLHQRPIALSKEEVTDSAIRRLLFEAGDDVHELMDLCEADITSKNEEKVQRYLANFKLVRQKLQEIEKNDAIQNFQPPIDGGEIMATFGLAPSKPVGELKEAIKNAILDGIIPNEHEAARDYMIAKGKEMGLQLAKK